jgi:hypothetical protein
MNTENRPNIITIGLLGGAIAQLVCFAWNNLAPVQLGAGEAAALATLLTAALQWLDRASKRSTDHVITKYTAID